MPQYDELEYARIANRQPDEFRQFRIRPGHACDPMLDAGDIGSEEAAKAHYRIVAPVLDPFLRRESRAP